MIDHSGPHEEVGHGTSLTLGGNFYYATSSFKTTRVDDATPEALL